MSFTKTNPIRLSLTQKRKNSDCDFPAASNSSSQPKKLCDATCEAEAQLEMPGKGNTEVTVASVSSGNSLVAQDMTPDTEVNVTGESSENSPATQGLTCARKTVNMQVSQSVVVVRKQDKLWALLSLLNENESDRTQIFVKTTRQAEFLASFLAESNLQTRSLHGAGSHHQRQEARILVSTAAAARLDIPDITHVVNYDMPNSIVEYVHRIGRAGNHYRMGKATSFLDPDTDNDLAQAFFRVPADDQLRFKRARSEEGGQEIGVNESYDMTPPVSSDEEYEQEKYIPQWAQGKQLEDAVVKQLSENPDPEAIFGPVYAVNLHDIFSIRKPRFGSRTSSASWDQPLMAKPSSVDSAGDDI